MARTLIRKYGKTALMAAASYTGDSPLFLMDYLLRFLRVAVMLSIWRILFAGKGTVSGMTLETVLTYALIAEVFAEPLACRTGLEVAFWEGTIATRFLRPLGFVGLFAAEMLGRWGFGFCAFSLPLLFAAPLLGVNPLPASPGAAGLFLLSLALSVAVGLALDFIFAALILWLDVSVWLIERFRAAVGTLLSGALLPLALLPWGLGKTLAWLPFAAMASAPLRIYTGTGDALHLIALQAGWAVLLWPAALALWAASRERIVSHGG
jgi:ABC-2 type transport system permease protein